MPFGFVFGAVVFVVLCLWYGNQVLASPSVPGIVVGVLWGLLGVTLSLGLLLRQKWARWAGMAAAALLGLVGARQILYRGDVLDHVVLLASLATFVLLAVPATGDLSRGAPESAPRRPLGAPLGWTSVATLVCLGAVVVSSIASAPDVTAERRADRREAKASPAPSRTPRPGRPLPQAAVPSSGEKLDWRSYGAALEQARAEKKPMLVDFYATWCGPCKMMDRKTFRDADVVERLGDVVAARVDAEEEDERDGYRGAELAGRFRVRSYPTVVLIGSDGRELSRRSGYQDPEEFLDWLDRVLGEPGSSRASMEP